MYFWDTKALSRQLRARQVSADEKMKYLMALAVLGLVALYLSVLLVPSGSPKYFTLVEAMVVIGTSVAGIICAYQANKRGDSQEFVDRFVCLSVPLSLRVAALFLVAYLVYYVVGYFIVGGSSGGAGWGASIESSAIAIMSNIVFYWRIRARIAGIAAGSGERLAPDGGR